MNIRKHLLSATLSAALALSTQAHAGLLGGSLGGGAGGALNGGINGLGTLGATGAGNMNSSFDSDVGLHRATSRTKQVVDGTSTRAVDHVQKGASTLTSTANSGVDMTARSANAGAATAQIATSNAVSTAADGLERGSEIKDSMSSAIGSKANTALSSAAGSAQTANDIGSNAQSSLTTARPDVSSGLTNNMEQNASATHVPAASTAKKARSSDTNVTGGVSPSADASAKHKSLNASANAQGSAGASASN